MNGKTVAAISLLLIGVPMLSQPLQQQAIAQDTPIEPSVRHAPLPWRPIGRDSLPGVKLDASLRLSYERRRDESLAQAHQQLMARQAGDTRFASNPSPADSPIGSASTGSSSIAP